jgi:hypothetical protein
MRLDHRDYYRLPWNLAENVFSWLEATKECNIRCEGCYSVNEPGGHKTLDQVRGELDALGRLRKCDAICIAGGEPLTHPEIEAVVRLVAERGYKPQLNTNGAAMNEGLLRRLKAAGLRKLSYHVDSRQSRPDRGGADERGLNSLRLELAEMTARVGGLYCSFNATVYPETLGEVPGLLEWAREHIDIVHGMNFIVYRAPHYGDRFDYYAGGRKVEFPAGEGRSADSRTPLDDVVAEIRKTAPDFEPCAYLNAFETPDVFRWLVTIRVGTRRAVYGYLGPRLMEAAQGFYHFMTGKYMGPADASDHRGAGRRLLAGALFDKGSAGALRAYLRAALKAPAELFRPLHMQVITMLSPVYTLDDGRQAMCDGCPDMEVWKGGLVCSCRLDELRRHGCFLSARPRAD